MVNIRAGELSLSGNLKAAGQRISLIRDVPGV
jgi:hypothetical protein